MDEELLKRINDSIETSSKVTRELLNDIKDGEADLAGLKVEIAVLKEQVKSLEKVVREGNGTLSLVTKIELLGQKIALIEKYIDKLEEAEEREGQQRKRLGTDIDDLERRLRHVEQVLARVVSAEETRARQEVEDLRRSVADADELESAQKVKDIEERKERNVLLWKVAGVVIAALVGAALAWMGLG